MSLFPRLHAIARSVFDRFSSTLRRSPFSASGFYEDGMQSQARVLDHNDYLHIPDQPEHKAYWRETAIHLFVAITSGIGLVWFFSLILNLSVN